MDKIYQIDDLQLLQDYLLRFPDIDRLRACLLSEFFNYASYRNVTEWNMAVRLCECLAVVGWGAHEPLEAVRGVCYNGNPNTFFVNRYRKPRFFDAAWSKRKEGLAIDYSQSFLYGSGDNDSPETAVQDKTIGAPQDIKLGCQRNWIAKNPICLTRGIANCYDTSRDVIESMEKWLNPELDRRMRPELYGNALNRIILNCSFSFYDNDHCKTNYIIADDSLKLKKKDFYSVLLGMFSEKEINDNGYYLRNRFSYGPFRPDTGTVRVAIVFEKEFSRLPPLRQKQVMSEYFIQAVGQCAKRLMKKVDYDFGLMQSDLSAILREWFEK